MLQPILKKERPILFSTPMVQAILEGRKTQTRRAVKAQPDPRATEVYFNPTSWPKTPWLARFKYAAPDLGWEITNCYKCPYGSIGDILWVRETWRGHQQDFGPDRIEYKATEKINLSDKWRPSIFMPREACRIKLEITDIRVERLGEISEDDAIAEGINGWDSPTGGDDYQDYYENYNAKKNDVYAMHFTDPESSFKSLWTKINKSYEPNTWVWAISFKRI